MAGPDVRTRRRAVSVFTALALTAGSTVGLTLATTGVAGAAPAFGTESKVYVPGNPNAATVDPTTGTAYVVGSDGGGPVSVVDEATNAITNTIWVDPQQSLGSDYPTGIAVDSATHTVYVCSQPAAGGGVVEVISGGAVSDVVTVGNGPAAIAVDPSAGSDGLVYVANAYGDNVSVIDQSSNSVIATVPVGGQPSAIAVNPSLGSGGTIYVTDEADGDVSVIDGSTNTVTATVAVGNAPDGVAVDPSKGSGGTIYVANSSDSTVSVIDGSDDQVTATVNVLSGSGPAGVSVDPVTGNVFVAEPFGPPSNQNVNNFSDYVGAVQQISESNDAVTATYDVAYLDYAVAADPVTGNVYVPAEADFVDMYVLGAAGTVSAPLDALGGIGVMVVAGAGLVAVQVRRRRRNDHAARQVLLTD